VPEALLAGFADDFRREQVHTGGEIGGGALMFHDFEIFALIIVCVAGVALFFDGLWRPE
jgi:hypothetical protein